MNMISSEHQRILCPYLKRLGVTPGDLVKLKVFNCRPVQPHVIRLKSRGAGRILGHIGHTSGHTTHDAGQPSRMRVSDKMSVRYLSQQMSCSGKQLLLAQVHNLLFAARSKCATKDLRCTRPTSQQQHSSIRTLGVRR